MLARDTIAVSNKAKRDIDWLPFIKSKIKVIHNGIDKFRTKTRSDARLSLAQEETKKKIIFSISELHHNKGIDIALHGIARLPQKIQEKILYCIAGDGEERENLEELVNSLGINACVKFLGLVPNAKELLSGADVFLLPSRTEAFPYVLLEAGLTGLPVIATSVGGIPEVITDMVNGILIHPRNPREVAEAITYLIEQSDKAKLFREKIKEVVSKNFSLNKMLESTHALYKAHLG